MEVSSVSVVVLHPDLSPRDQTAWAFTDADDARAVAGFLNRQLGNGDEIAWVEFVPLSRSLNKKVLDYLDRWAEVVDETLLDED